MAAQLDAVVHLWEKIDSNVLVGTLNNWSQDLLGFKALKAISMYGTGSHAMFLGGAVVTYLVVIFGLQSYLRSTKTNLRDSKMISRYAFFHNVVMSAFSLYMFIDAIVKVYEFGGFKSFDSYMQIGFQPRFAALHDLFYWSKFLELIDTLILVVKNKELGFLHVFHHCTTGIVCYISLQQPLWMGVWTNGLVHVWMYAHFARPINFIRPHLTTMQIVQFIFVLSTYNYWWWQYTDLPFSAIAFGDVCYSVYLIFFCKFFYENYIAPKPKARVGGAPKPTKKEQ